MRMYWRVTTQSAQPLLAVSLIVVSFLVTLNFIRLTRSRNAYWDSRFHRYHTFKSIFSRSRQSSHCKSNGVVGLKSHGLYLSAGEFGSMSTLLGTIHELRRKCVFEVIVVGHCEEISFPTIELLNALDGIVVRSLCARFSGPKFNRFQSFFTKHLLVVFSIHRHFAMIDNDMIWFETPSELTNNLIERNASAFIFNAMVFKDQTWRLPDFIQRAELQTFLSSHLTYEQIDTNEYLKQSRVMNELSNVEVDASYIYYDVVKAKSALQLLYEAIDIYRFGFGDQEAYWLVSTLAGVPIEIDRWAAASYSTVDTSFFCFLPYCGCNNPQIHYDPTATSNPRLFGINLGALIEMQADSFTKTKFYHVLCPKMPLHYSSPETLSYTIHHRLEPCMWPGACVRHEDTTIVTAEHKLAIQRRRSLHIKTMLIEWTLNGII